MRSGPRGTSCWTAPTPAGHNAGAVVSNAGQITVADRGLAALVAPRVENSGLDSGAAGLGPVGLGVAWRSGRTTGTPIDINTVDRTDTTIDFYGDGLVQFRVSRGSEAADQLIRHTETGTIDAQGGTVLMTADAAADLVNTAINLDGVVLAAGAAASAGQVAMVGEGDIVFGSQSLVEAGDGSVWIDSTADVTQADGSAILTRDLAARGAKVALTSYDNYAERLAGRAQEGVNGRRRPAGPRRFPLPSVECHRRRAGNRAVLRPDRQPDDRRGDGGHRPGHHRGRRRGRPRSLVVRRRSPVQPAGIRGTDLQLRGAAVDRGGTMTPPIRPTSTSAR